MVWGEVAAVDFGVGVAFLHFILFYFDGENREKVTKLCQTVCSIWY